MWEIIGPLSSDKLSFEKTRLGGRAATQYQITLSQEDLHGLFSGDEGLARLMEKVLNQVLQFEATEAVGALPYDRTAGRCGYRNGNRDRPLPTRVGSLTACNAGYSHITRASKQTASKNSSFYSFCSFYFTNISK